MKKLNPLLLILVLCVSKSTEIFAQIDSSNQFCDLYSRFFQSPKTIGNVQFKKDSVCVLYDVDSLLTKCRIQTWGAKKIETITSGSNFEAIKKGGIFTQTDDMRNYYVVSIGKRWTVGDTTFYSVYNARSNAESHIWVVKKRKKYLVTKRGDGAF